MLARFWSFITGYVIVDVQGPNLEKLLNMIVGRGLFLWDVRWLEQQKIRLKMRVNGVRPLRHICRRTRCRFRIVGKRGLPFPAARMSRRKALLAGAVVSAAMIYLITSFIWFVEISGNKQIPAELIIRTAERGGLSAGTMRSELDKDAVEKYIRNHIPEISWVGIQITGTRALIEIAEKTIVPLPDNAPADLTAEKDGLVDEILVLAGQPAVKEGDTVKKGDVLISGVVKPPQPEAAAPGQVQESKPLGPVSYVRARGIVRARIWYDGYGESSLVEAGTRRTGRQTQVLSIRLFGREIILQGSRVPSFEDYTTGVKVKKLPEWRNIRVPVEIVTTDYYEVEKYRDIIGISQAREKAADQARENAARKVPPDAKVLREITEEIPARGGNVVRVKQLVEVLEDIGVASPLREEKPQSDRLPRDEPPQAEHGT